MTSTRGKVISIIIVIVAMFALPMVTSAAGTTVPGHSGSRYDSDNNGYPDVGQVVTGKYNSLYAYDASGAFFWDLGDGRVQASTGVTSPDDLDQESLTSCVYQVVYRGTFDNNPFMDSGWIKNMINCKGVDHGTFNSTIVHESDPRYTGNPDYAIWGNWEYHVDTYSGSGNQVRPENHVGS